METVSISDPRWGRTHRASLPHGQLCPWPTDRHADRTSGLTSVFPSVLGEEGWRLTVRQPMRLCSKGRWKARGSPHQSSNSVAALWKLAGFCKCCGGKGKGLRLQEEATPGLTKEDTHRKGRREATFFGFLNLLYTRPDPLQQDEASNPLKD